MVENGTKTDHLERLGLPNLFKQPLPKVWGLVREVARDGECVTWMDGTGRGQIGRDGTWMEGTGRHVDGGDGTPRGRRGRDGTWTERMGRYVDGRTRDAHRNFSMQHPQ